jgi:hypothetical protein
MVASKCASSGMMLRAVPPCSDPTVMTTGSKALKHRVTSACRPVTISAIAETGSRPRCGDEPCAPCPRTVTSSQSLAAINVPGRAQKTPGGYFPDVTCIP